MRSFMSVLWGEMSLKKEAVIAGCKTRKACCSMALSGSWVGLLFLIIFFFNATSFAWGLWS